MKITFEGDNSFVQLYLIRMDVTVRVFLSGNVIPWVRIPTSVVQFTE